MSVTKSPDGSSTGTLSGITNDRDATILSSAITSTYNVPGSKVIFDWEISTTRNVSERREGEAKSCICWFKLIRTILLERFHVSSTGKIKTYSSAPSALDPGIFSWMESRKKRERTAKKYFTD